MQVCDGETVLDSSSGQVMRNVNVLNVYIVNSKQQVNDVTWIHLSVILIYPAFLESSMTCVHYVRLSAID